MRLLAVPRAAASTLEALKSLIAERHAKFNDTLYQLEPDVKESPGALRDLFGAQTIAKLTDPALLSRGGSGPSCSTTRVTPKITVRPAAISNR